VERLHPVIGCLCMENTLRFFEMLYGIWAAGCVPCRPTPKLHPLEVRHIVRTPVADVRDSVLH